MATNPIIRRLPRDKLFQVFKTAEMVKLVEDILYGVGETLPENIQLVQDVADEALTTAIAALQDIQAHIAELVGAHPASAISSVPVGDITADNVQGAINELDDEKQPRDDTLTALAALVSAADRVIYATGVDAFAMATFTAAARTFTAAVDAAAQRGVLGLGTMATQSASAVAISGGNVLLAAGALGYAAGNGGTVAQATSKGTGVTLDKLSGEITMNAAALAAGATVTFTLSNSTIAATDRLILNHVSGGTFMAYELDAQPAAGSALVGVRNRTGGSLSEAIVIGFTVVKSAAT